MINELDYDSLNWSDYFYYCASSKSGLRWKITRYSAHGKKLEIWPGKEAGTLHNAKNGDNKPYGVALDITGKRRHYKVHRIIAVLYGMKVNGKVIDHINGQSSDNHIENLRVTTIEINSRNCKNQYNCPYGISGVGFQEDRLKNSYFIARAVINGKRQQQSFPIKKLGIMQAFKLACIARDKYLQTLNSTGAGYTDRHMTKTSAYVPNI